MYINGLKMAWQTNLTPYVKPQVAALLFGASYNFGDSLFNFCPVTLDAFHIYNHALSDGEGQSAYASEAAQLPPTVSIVVKTVRVNMMQLVPGSAYQLESSTDLSSWIVEGLPFTATDSTAYQDVDVVGVQKYFRVIRLSP